jgi:phosphomannomutase
VTASHNPPDYNGMKFVREGSRPISRDTGLKDIRALAEKNNFDDSDNPGSVSERDIFSDYIAHLLSYIDSDKLAPLKIVVNAGNGSAGPIVDLLEPHLPFEFIKLHHEPDGMFPNGVPNPMVEVNRQSTIDRVAETGANLGIAWDGDYDRCFFFDGQGRFIEGYYIVGLLARAFLENSPGESIVHDPRLIWNTLEVVEQASGKAIESLSGHAFMKQTMRKHDAAYGGEMSAHHYFRDFSYADSGMIPWLLVAGIMSQTGKSLAALVDERMTLFPVSGEINRKVADANEVLKRTENLYAKNAISVDRMDGVSVQFADWRFNLRASNTEPLVRLNVESRGDPKLMRKRTAELLAIVGGKPG